MSKNPNKQWDRCLYCDASIKGDDALVAELHDPYCPHGKALARLTRELDEAQRRIKAALAAYDKIMGEPWDGAVKSGAMTVAHHLTDALPAAPKE